MKLWDKGFEVNKLIEDFTVGKDYLLDQKLVKYDCIASKAHAKMLYKIKLLTKKELAELIINLDEIINLSEKGEFVINKSDEDCHTTIENYLTKKLGETGKKIHSCRSRNDQVLTALRLYEKNELEEILLLLTELKKVLNKQSNKNIGIQFPGYTHMQKAMPTTIDTWLNCFFESTKENIFLLKFVINLTNKSPLGSAAGFGVPVFNLDKEFTAKEMGFKSTISNPIYAQMTRAKYDSIILSSLTQIMFDLNKLSNDLVLFNTTEFGYIILSKDFCTGSSIMPQKKNPDALELIRANYHIVLGEEFKQKSLISNLLSGYNRDIQLTKEPIMNSIEITKISLKVIILIINELKINKKKCSSAMTNELFATEEVYKLVKQGMPFREAYKKIGKKFDQ